jgi:hypothetical protein
MKLKIYVFRFVIAILAFGLGAGLLSAGRYLQSVFRTKEQKVVSVQPVNKPEVASVPPIIGQPVPTPTFVQPATTEQTNSPVESEENTDYELDFFGDYYMVDKLPKGFKDFQGFSIITRDFETESDEYPSGIPIPPKGSVQAGKEFKFTRISLGNKQIAFETEPKNGISYKFVGKQVDELKYDETLEATIGITGRLTKVRNGKKIAEMEIRLAIDESCGC